MAINLISVPPYSEQFSNQMAFAQVREDDPILSRVWKYPLASLLNVPVLISAIAESIFSSIGMLTFYYLSAERSESFKERAVNSFQVINLSTRRIFWLGNARQSEVSISSKQNASQKGVSKASESGFQNKVLLVFALGVICSGAYYFDIFGNAARLVSFPKDGEAQPFDMNSISSFSSNSTENGFCIPKELEMEQNLVNQASGLINISASIKEGLPSNVSALETCPALPEVVSSKMSDPQFHVPEVSSNASSSFTVPAIDLVEIHKTVKASIFLFGIIRLLYEEFS